MTSKQDNFKLSKTAVITMQRFIISVIMFYAKLKDNCNIFKQPWQSPSVSVTCTENIYDSEQLSVRQNEQQNKERKLCTALCDIRNVNFTILTTGMATGRPENCSYFKEYNLNNLVGVSISRTVTVEISKGITS